MSLSGLYRGHRRFRVCTTVLWGLGCTWGLIWGVGFVCGLGPGVKGFGVLGISWDWKKEFEGVPLKGSTRITR